MNIMIDIETLGNNSNAVIVSIGAVYFGKQRIGKRFYSRVNIDSCIEAGLQMDASTVEWWLQQGDDAKSVFKGIEKAPSLSKVLDKLAKFVKPDALVWGNGADFDCVILTNAYKACGKQVPWKFWNTRCFRTLKNLYPNIRPAKGHLKHNALEDAIHQARHAMHILAAM